MRSAACSGSADPREHRPLPRAGTSRSSRMVEFWRFTPFSTNLRAVEELRRICVIFNLPVMRGGSMFAGALRPFRHRPQLPEPFIPLPFLYL